MNGIVRISALLALSVSVVGCTTIRETTKRSAEMVKKDFVATRERVREFLTYTPTKTEKRPVPPSYCYRVLQDVICYKDPQPGAESRLVAYQETVVEAPPPAPMLVAGAKPGELVKGPPTKNKRYASDTPDENKAEAAASSRARAKAPEVYDLSEPDPVEPAPVEPAPVELETKAADPFESMVKAEAASKESEPLNKVFVADPPAVSEDNSEASNPAY